jgi:hypothetical protein
MPKAASTKACSLSCAGVRGVVGGDASIVPSPAPAHGRPVLVGRSGGLTL